MVTVKVYVEGGGDTNELRTKCRKGFREFFRKAGLEERMPRVVACGSRQNAYEDFCTAIGNSRADEFPLLLVDSEAPVAAGATPWTHLGNRPGDRWAKPADATDDHAHLMVQCMESWFLADKGCLAQYYGAQFNTNALPANPNIEAVLKDDVQRGLADATRHCTSKGEYAKGRHSFDILERVDPTSIYNACPHARRLVDTLNRLSCE